MLDRKYGGQRTTGVGGLFLFFHHVGPEDGVQIVWLSGKFPAKLSLGTSVIFFSTFN